MKKLQLLTLIIAGALFSCTSGNKEVSREEAADHEHHDAADTEDSGEKAPAKSPRTAAMSNIGTAHVHIDYGSPSVRGRVIWGGLVPYDEVWVTGAHKATSINLPADVRINGNEVKAGKYGLFTIPGQEEWTIILNANYEQHLADDYDAEQDILRFQVSPYELETVQEALKYKVTGGPNEGSVAIEWEKIGLQFDIELI